MAKKECFICSNQLGLGARKIKAGYLCKKCYSTLDNAIKEEHSLLSNVLLGTGAAVNKLTAEDAIQKVQKYRDTHPGFFKAIANAFDDAAKEADEAAMREELAQNMKKQRQGVIKEIKLTCSACGHIHFFDGSDVVLNAAHAMAGLVYVGAAGAVERSMVKDLDRCPQCGSRAIKLEEVENVI